MKVINEDKIRKVYFRTIFGGCFKTCRGLHVKGLKYVFLAILLQYFYLIISGTNLVGKRKRSSTDREEWELIYYQCWYDILCFMLKNIEISSNIFYFWGDFLQLVFPVSFRSLLVVNNQSKFIRTMFRENKYLFQVYYTENQVITTEIVLILYCLS